MPRRPPLGLINPDDSPIVAIDALDLPEDTQRVLLFRAIDAKHRAAAGLLGIFYRGDVTDNMQALRRYVLERHGPGRYRVVVQRMVGGSWAYFMSTVTTVNPSKGERDR